MKKRLFVSRMDRQEILKKIEEIRREVEKDQSAIFRSKILERRFHLHPSHRGLFFKKILHKIRKRLILEIGLILQPILDNQKEINLRFLKEIEKLKEVVSLRNTDPVKKGDDSPGQKPSGKNPG